MYLYRMLVTEPFLNIILSYLQIWIQNGPLVFVVTILGQKRRWWSFPRFHGTKPLASKHLLGLSLRFVVVYRLETIEFFFRFLDYVSGLMQGSHSDNLWKFLDTVYQSKIPRVGVDLSVSIHPSIKVGFV